jgi:predicted component of type VI protein secretion system
MVPMRREEIERVARRKPFQPFVVELIGGKRYRFKSPEQFIVTRSAIHTLDRNFDPVLVSLSMIATVKVENARTRTA